MRWWASWRQRWARAGKIYPTLAMALILVALVATLYSLNQARAGAKTQLAASATVSLGASSTTTAPSATPSLPPLSGPTPTVAAGGHPYVPSNGSAPFIVQAVTVLDPCGLGRGACDAQSACPAGGPGPFQLLGNVTFPKNAPDGYFTYRWRGSDGSVTAPQTAHYSWDDAYGQNDPVYNYSPNPAIADGRSFTVQLEIITPNPMISLPSNHINLVCLPDIKSLNPAPFMQLSRMYDCATGGAQTFSYSGSVTITPSPSYSFSYYWKRSDGSVSPTRTVTTTAGATSVPLIGDNMTVSYPNPPPPTDSSPIAFYSDTLVVLNPPSAVNATTISQFQQTADSVAIPNCSLMTPTPTATATPTATPVPTATATP